MIFFLREDESECITTAFAWKNTSTVVCVQYSMFPLLLARTKKIIHMKKTTT